jgi:molybdopterin/thiamine biosynthesis adenylyltransferase
MLPDPAARFPALIDVPADAAERLGALHLGVIGCGSIGDDVIDALLRMGVARLLVVDPGRIKRESLLTHRADPADVGRYKVDVVAQRAAALVPATRVVARACRFEELSDAELAGLDALVLAGDNVALELALGQRCARLGLPLLQASVHGATLTAQVRALCNADPARGACLVCGFGAWEFAELERGTVFSCAGGPVERATRPTRSLRHLCALAANLAVDELVRRVLRLVDARDPGADQVLEYSGYTQRLVAAPLARNPACPCEHLTWRQARAARPLAQCSLRELLLEQPGACSLEVEGLRFVRATLCDCDAHPLLGRFLAPGADAGPCAGCGALRVPHPFHMYELVPVAVLREHLSRTLNELGAAAAACVLVRGALDAVRISGPTQPDPEASGHG